MLKIGITGGMGSGKTTVCKILETLGVPVYYADVRAKQLMVEDATVQKEIKAFFGDAIYGEDGSLKKAALAKQVFADKNKLQQLEKIIHPAVARDFEVWAAGKHFFDVPYMVKEAALLFESGSYKSLHQTVLVLSPLNLRINRVMLRDNNTREDILARIEKQWPEEKKQTLANHTLINDEKQLLLPQVLQLHKYFCEMAKAV